MQTGIILDIETTGLNHETDKIIEVGALEFAFGDGQPPRVLTLYGALQDPGQPLSDDIKRVTHLQDSMLAGQEIDWQIVRSMIERASLLVAHNAAFDRSFLARTPVGDLLAARQWACSMNHINWNAKGHRTLQLNHLAADQGFVNPFAHRALFDCATTFRVIEDHIDELIARASEKEWIVIATGAPFDSKDLLKARGYRWDPDKRSWFKVVGDSGLATERAYLAEAIYRGSNRPLVVEANRT